MLSFRQALSKHLLLTTMCLLSAAVALPAHADIPEPAWSMTLGHRVMHYREDPEHHERPGLVALDYSPADAEWFVGGATFLNSFRQRSTYAYAGKRYGANQSPFYLQLTAGLLSGYRGEHRDKIPLNRFGVAPAVIPSVGFEHNGYRGEVFVLGNSGLLFGWGVDF